MTVNRLIEAVSTVYTVYGVYMFAKTRRGSLAFHQVK
jgi:hypothetical protein